MSVALSALMLAGLSLSAGDTVLPVSRGDRLEVSRIGGRLDLEATDGNTLEILVDGSSESYRIARKGGEIRLRAGSRGHSADVPRAYRIRAPRWLGISIEGQEVDVEIRGSRAAVSVRIQEGDVRVRDHQGSLSVRAMDGGVWLEDVRGDVIVDAPDDEILIQRASGSFVLNSLDGDIEMRGVDASSIEVATIDGDVTFEGSLAPGGRSSVTTHDGDVTLAVAPGASLVVEALARGGTFSSGFPVEVARLRNGTEVEFRLGAGEAWLRIETFDGDVRVRGLGERDSMEEGRRDQANQRRRERRGGGG